MWRSLSTSVLYFSPFFISLLTVSLFEVFTFQTSLPTGSHSHCALSESVFVIILLIKSLSLVPLPTKPKSPSMMLRAPTTWSQLLCVLRSTSSHPLLGPLPGPLSRQRSWNDISSACPCHACISIFHRNFYSFGLRLSFKIYS